MIRTFLVIGLSALGAVACAADSASMVILRNSVPGDGCTISGSQTAAFIARGSIDAQSPLGYVFTPVILSRVDANRNSERLIFLEGAEVKLDAVADDGTYSEVAAFSVFFSGSITPGGTTGMAFEITPPGLDEGEYLAHVQVFGSLEGGDVESQIFNYPLSVENLAVDLGLCSELDSGFDPESGSSCNPFQDGLVECCDTGDEFLCPAEGSAE